MLKAKKIVLFMLLIAGLSYHEGWSQDTLYYENFGDGTVLPTGWSTTGEVSMTGINESSGYEGSSGEGSILFGDNIGSGGSIVISGIINTQNYTNIQIIWGAYESETFPEIVFAFYDGSSWVEIPYSTNLTQDSWQLVNEGVYLNLPSTSEGLSDLEIRISYSTGLTFGTYQLDDFTIIGVFTEGDYYWNGNGPLNLLNSWVSNADGVSGSHPGSFDLPNTNFWIVNGSNATITSNWVVNGSKSKTIVGDGTTPVTLTIPSGYSLNGTVDVHTNSILRIENINIPTIDSLYTNSTVSYSAMENQNIAAKTYENLTVEGSGDKILIKTTTVNGNLNLSGKLAMNGQLFYIKGTLSGSGTFKSGVGESSRLVFVGSEDGIIGSLKTQPDSSHFQLIRLDTQGMIDIDSDTLHIQFLQLLNGELNLNNSTPIISNFFGSDGALLGTSSSKLIINEVNTSLNNLRFSLNSNVLNSLTLNSSNPLNLQSDLTITDTLSLSSGVFNINDNTLTLIGAPIQGNANSLVTASTSNLIFSGSTDGVFIPAGVTQVDSLTIDNSAGVSMSHNISADGHIAISGPLDAGVYTFSGAASAAILDTVYTAHASGFSGAFANNGEIEISPTATIVYNAEGPQEVSPEEYGNLVLSGSGIKTAGGDFTVSGDLSITNDASFAAPNELNIKGNFNPVGDFDHNNGQVVFSGSTAQSTGAGTTFYNLTLNNSAGLTLSGNNHNIVNTLKLQNGTLNTNDALTLLSTQAGTARLAKVESGADISGLVTVQRYIDASQSHWRHCGVTVKGQTLADWTPENHIKLSSPSSVYFHSEPDSAGEGWYVPSALSDPVKLGQGVKLWLWNPTFFSQGNRTLDNTGTVHHGEFDFNVTKTETGYGSGGWNYLANPYPCEIDWEAEGGWNKSGVNGTIYIYDAVQQNYIAYNSGTGGNSNGIIAPGQAFFVRAEGESPQLTVNEDAKVESGATFYRKRAIEKELTLTLRNTQNKYDQAFIRFMPEASDQYDYYDGKKMYGSHVNISSKTDGSRFSINSLADDLSGRRSIPLEVRVNKKGTHTLSFEGLDSFDPAVEIKFIDHQSDSVVDVRTVREYTFNMPGFVENERFEILVGESLTLSLGDAVAASGENVAIPVTVENYKDVLTIQFSVNWDPGDLEYISVSDFGFSSISLSQNFNTSGTASGHLAFSWDDATLQGVSMNPGDTLFIINMAATMPMDSETEISFSETPLPVEASDKSFTEVSVALKNGKVTVPELLKIAGTIKNNAGLPVKNAEVVVKDGDNAHRVSTDESGGFEIEMAQGKTYTLMPETVEEPSFSGLSTIDIALIRRHILNLKEFDNPVHWLAADLNQSKSISTLDIAILRSIILGNGSFQPKWRFVPEAQLTMENIFDADTFLTVNAASSVSNINFTGVKLGDVNDSWDGSELRQNDQQGLELIVDRRQVAQEKVKALIRVRKFEQISAYQFTVSWDPSEMKLNEITENPYGAYFGVANLDKGRLSVAWDHESGKSLDIEDFAGLMILEFTAKEASANVQITSDITPILFADANLKPVPFSIFNVEDEKESNFSVSVYPNPVSDKANFNIFAPESGIVNIEIIDLTGKLVKGLNNVNVTKGQNRLEIALGNDEKDHLAGLLIYKVWYNNTEQYHGKLLLRKQ